jgi:hypothetical protein
MKILDKKKGIGGEYLNGWAGKALHGQICRNPRNLERDLRRERREGAGSGEGRKKRSRGSGWRRLGRHTSSYVWHPSRLQPEPLLLFFLPSPD